MALSFSQLMSKSNSKSNNSGVIGSLVCSGRGKSYCLLHRRYFETSYCPDCSRSSHH